MSRCFAVLNLIGIVSSAAGGILLFFAMPLERTNYRLVETENHEVAICFRGKKVVAGFGGPLVVSDEPCPEGLGASLTPAIQYEHPSFLTWGLVLLVLGFALQMPAAFIAIRRP